MLITSPLIVRGRVGGTVTFGTFSMQLWIFANSPERPPDVWGVRKTSTTQYRDTGVYHGPLTSRIENVDVSERLGQAGLFQRVDKIVALSHHFSLSPTS